jgi:hypothetical protein
MRCFCQDLTGEPSTETLFGSEHSVLREKVLNLTWNKREKKAGNIGRSMFVHFSYTSSLANFGSRFHLIWQEIFEGTPLDDIPVTYANRLTDSLKHLLLRKRPDKEAIKLLPTESD